MASPLGDVKLSQRCSGQYVSMRHWLQSGLSMWSASLTHFFTDNIVSSQGLDVRVEGKLSSVLMEARMVQSGDQESVQAKDVITGVTNWSAEITHSPVSIHPHHQRQPPLDGNIDISESIYLTVD